MTCSILENPATKAKSRKVQLDPRDAVTRSEVTTERDCPAAAVVLHDTYYNVS